MSNFKLSAIEQETTITANAAEKKIYVSTAYPPHIRHYDKLCEARPDYCVCTRHGDPYCDYEILDKKSHQLCLKPYGYTAKTTEEE